jgi:hypothetical protein
MPPKKKGLFPNMPYGDRVILVLAALLFAAGEFHSLFIWSNMPGTRHLP